MQIDLFLNFDHIIIFNYRCYKSPGITTGGLTMNKSVFLSLIIVLFFSSISFSQNLEKKQDIYYKDGEVFSGIHSTYYASGQLESERNFVMGAEEGISVYFFEDGNIKEKRAWRNGKKHGTWSTLSEAGIKTGEANFQNDQKHGKWFIWDEKGTLRYEMNYNNGQKDGVWFMWDENGILKDDKTF